MESTNENIPSMEVNQSVVETVELKTNGESIESNETIEVPTQSEGDLEKVIEIVDERTEDGTSNETIEKTEEGKEDKKEEEKIEEKKEDDDKMDKKEQPDEWTLIGSVCLTPCGHGVISQRTDDGTAIVLLVASYFLVRQVIHREEEKSVRLASGYFSISSLRKPTFETTPPAYVILRAQVLRDVIVFLDSHI